MSYREQQKAELREFAQLLVKEGFRVWMGSSGERINAAWEGKLGSVSVGYLTGGFRYTSMHKPCVECGTGFMLFDGPLTVESMKRTCETFTTYPEYAKHVVKDTVDSWLKRESVFGICSEVIAE